MSLFLILLAAGDSKRLKSNTPKPFHIVNNKTLLEHSFNAFRYFNEIKKTIHSAVANAENNFQYDIDNLFVKEAYCGKSIVMKRFRPRAKGRASPIKKPYSNVTIILSDKLRKLDDHGTKS